MVYLEIGESRTRVKSGVQDQLSQTVLQGTSSTGRFTRSIYQVEKKIFQHVSLPAHTFLFQKARNTAEKEESLDIRQEFEKTWLYLYY